MSDSLIFSARFFSDSLKIILQHKHCLEFYNITINRAQQKSPQITCNSEKPCPLHKSSKRALLAERTKSKAPQITFHPSLPLSHLSFIAVANIAILTESTKTKKNPNYLSSQSALLSPKY